METNTPQRLSKHNKITLVTFVAIMIIGALGGAISGVHYNPIYLTENTSLTRIEYVNTTGILYITNAGNVSITNNERTNYQTLKAGTIYSNNTLVCLSDGTNCLTGNATGAGDGTGGWVNTTTTTNTTLAVNIINKTLTLTSDTASQTLLIFGMDRKWRFFQANTGASTGLVLKPDDSGKNFQIWTASNLPIIKFDTVTGGVPFTSYGGANVTGNLYVGNVTYTEQAVLESGLSGYSDIGVVGAVLVPNDTTRYDGVRVNNQAGFVFNGSQNINLSGIEFVNISDTFSIEMWFYRNATNEANIFAQNYLTANSRCVIHWTASSILEAACYNGSSYLVSKSMSSINVSVLHHVVWNYANGTYSELWVDGINSTGTTNPSTGGGIGSRIGSQADGAGRFLVGNILVLNVRHGLLSASEVYSEFLRGANDCANINPTGLVLVYCMNKTPDVHQTYSNSTHVKDVAYISTGEYYHECYDDSGVLIKGCGS